MMIHDSWSFGVSVKDILIFFWIILIPKYSSRRPRKIFCSVGKVQRKRFVASAASVRADPVNFDGSKSNPDVTILPSIQGNLKIKSGLFIPISIVRNQQRRYVETMADGGRFLPRQNCTYWCQQMPTTLLHSKTMTIIRLLWIRYYRNCYHENDFFLPHTIRNCGQSFTS